MSSPTSFTIETYLNNKHYLLFYSTFNIRKTNSICFSIYSSRLNSLCKVHLLKLHMCPWTKIVLARTVASRSSRTDGKLRKIAPFTRFTISTSFCKTASLGGGGKDFRSWYKRSTYSCN